MKKTMLILTLCVCTASLTAETKKPVDGFGGAKWGASMDEVRKNIKGKISFDDEKKMIVTRDGEILYRYGFFFKPKEAAPAQGAATQPQGQAQPATEGESKLLYVNSEFPYVPFDKLKEKIVAEYGEPSGDTLRKNQGALVWDSANGVIIMWVDAYEKQSFCRKISYLSKSISKELNDRQKEIFSKRELEVIKNLVP